MIKNNFQIKSSHQRFGAKLKVDYVLCAETLKLSVPRSEMKAANAARRVHSAKTLKHPV